MDCGCSGSAVGSFAHCYSGHGYISLGTQHGFKIFIISVLRGKLGIAVSLKHILTLYG